LLLSDAYRDAAGKARERGLRVAEATGAQQHLDIVGSPPAITDALVHLANA
jgi:hypothetical protein